jgi:hypothetical protein
MTEHILELSTLAPKRARVKLTWAKHPEKDYGPDEKPETESAYVEMATSDDLSIADNTWIKERIEDLSKLQRPDGDLSDDEKLAADMLLNKFATLALIDPPEGVIPRVPRQAKWSLIEVFLIPFAEKLLPTWEAVKGSPLRELAIPTGENSPPA